jgi:hypothetical protein
MILIALTDINSTTLRNFPDNARKPGHFDQVTNEGGLCGCNGCEIYTGALDNLIVRITRIEHTSHQVD